MSVAAQRLALLDGVMLAIVEHLDRDAELP
jgi:hypothetical protein